MGRAERDKGARFEREVASRFREFMGESAAMRVSQAGFGGKAGGDVDAPPYHVECKNAKPRNINWTLFLERLVEEESQTRHEPRMPILIINISTRKRLKSRQRVMMTLDHYFMIETVIRHHCRLGSITRHHEKTSGSTHMKWVEHFDSIMSQWEEGEPYPVLCMTVTGKKNLNTAQRVMMDFGHFLRLARCIHETNGGRQALEKILKEYDDARRKEQEANAGSPQVEDEESAADPGGG